PPPPPPVYVPPAPHVDVCASVGRRVSISGCI
ncbi:RNA-binding protein, partial [Mycolicibacterium vaccae]